LQKHLGSEGGFFSDPDMDECNMVIQALFTVKRKKMALLGHDSSQPETCLK